MTPATFTSGQKRVNPYIVAATEKEVDAAFISKITGTLSLRAMSAALPFILSKPSNIPIAPSIILTCDDEEYVSNNFLT